METSSRKYLKYLGYVEGFSLLALLLIGMPLKYFAGLPEISKIIGTIHGVLFLMYVVTLVSAGKSMGLTSRQIMAGLILSCLPFGPFIFESKILKR